MKALLTAAVALVVATTASFAGADPLKLSALPATQPLAPPPAAAMPKVIPAAEHVSGLYMSRAPLQNGAAAFYPAVFDSAEGAAAYEKMYGTDPRFDATSTLPVSRTCYTRQVEDGTLVEMMSPADAQNWHGMPSTFIPLYNGTPRVQVMRAQRWLDTPGGASLETTVFWVDLQTGGMREQARSTAQLTRVATPYAGIEVYAARAGADQVEFVVRRDPAQAGVAQLRGTMTEAPSAPNANDPFAVSRAQLNTQVKQSLNQLSMLTSQLPQGQTQQSDCSHMSLRLRVKSEPPAPATAPPGTPVPLILTVPQEPPQPLRRDSATVTTTALLGVSREMTTRQAEALGLNAEQQTSMVTGLRSRTLSIHFGISRLSQDAEPVVSLSYNWSDRARDSTFLIFF